MFFSSSGFVLYGIENKSISIFLLICVRNWLDSVLNYSYIFQTPSIKINHIIYNKYDTLGKYKQWFEPNIFSLIEHSKPYEELKEIQEDIKVNVGNNVVKSISAALPHVDNIGHNILHANNIFINDILNNQMLDHDTQKAIIHDSKRNWWENE